MVKRRFRHVDVFPAPGGRGNPLAVVVDAEGLDSPTMQAIAAWTNVIETVFLLPPETPTASYRVRIFTPRRELDFAGHPSVGAAHAVLEAGLARPVNGHLLQACRAGLLPVRVEGDGPDRQLLVQSPETRILAQRSGEDPMLRALLGDRLATTGGALVDNGRCWWVAELLDEVSVRRWTPDFPAIAALAEPVSAMGLVVFARRDAPSSGLVVRALMPFHGHYEDPASGAANAALAGYLHASGRAKDLGSRYTVSQGREVDRDAALTLLEEEGRIWVGGRSRTVVSGSLSW